MSAPKRVVMDDGVSFPSLTAAGRYVALAGGRSYKTCAVGIAYALQGTGHAYGHSWALVPESGEPSTQMPATMCDGLVRRLNDACVDVIRATRGRWCDGRDTCMVEGARIGWCRMAWDVAIGDGHDGRS